MDFNARNAGQVLPEITALAGSRDRYEAAQRAFNDALAVVTRAGEVLAAESRARHASGMRFIRDWRRLDLILNVRPCVVRAPSAPRRFTIEDAPIP